MSLNSRDKQTYKKALQAKDKVNQVNQGSEAKKFFEKARKENKKKNYQRRQKKLKSAAT